jgi:hypothetical protein
MAPLKLLAFYLSVMATGIKEVVMERESRARVALKKWRRFIFIDAGCKEMTQLHSSLK